MSEQTPVQAEILQTGDPLVMAAQIVINAPAEAIFDILVQPRCHPQIDGSGSVQGMVRGPERLAMGDRFQMRMRIRVTYWITSTVVEFEPNRRIAWAHMLGNRWSYDLEPQADGGTLVREMNNLRAAGWRAHVSPVSRKPGPVQRAIAESLVRLKDLAEKGG